MVSELHPCLHPPHPRRGDIGIRRAEHGFRNGVDAGDVALVEQVVDEDAEAPAVAAGVPVEADVGALLRPVQVEVGRQ